MHSITIKVDFKYKEENSNLKQIQGANHFVN